jgi:2-polyprenyl-6-methoxyphenol hydroxylase-like FAD-dependent oxidoreductase
MRTTVTIVGAGPTGLMAALQCQRFGLDYILIDKKPGPTKESRALAIQARTLEIFRQMGLADQFMLRGYKTEFVNFFSNTKHKAKFPLGNIGAGISEFPFMLVLEQYHTEQLLYNALQLAGNDVLWNTEIVSVSETRDEIHVQCMHKGSAVNITSKYLIGADGAGSFVRHYLQTPFTGGTYENIFFVADILLPSAFLKKELCVFLSKKTFAAFFPMQAEHQFRMVGIMPRNTAENKLARFEDISETLTSHIGLPVNTCKANWFSIYRLHHRMANNFTRGHIFLCGDAAHIHSPVGGQGMNTGLQDAYNLVWKLWLIEKYDAPGSLLETYEAERKPFAKILLQTTDRVFRLFTNPRFTTNILRLHVLPFIVQTGLRFKKIRQAAFRVVSQTGFSYRHSTLAKGKAGKVCAGERFPYFYITQEGKKVNAQHLLCEPGFVLLLYNITPALIKLPSCIIIKVIENNPANKEVLKHAGLPRRFICLVRPDGYISFISEKYDTKEMKNFLQKHYFSSRCM